MTALAPFAQLIDMTSNQTVAATSTITAWGYESVLDASPSGHVSVPLGDAGDGFTSFSSFATVALSAAGGSGVPAMPAPLKLTLSLSGPNGAVDFEWIGFTVERKVASSELVLELAGECSYGALYSALPAGNGRTTMTDLALSDALSGPQGTIAPLDAAVQNRLLSADGTIPYLSGLTWADVALVQAHVGDSTATLMGGGSDGVLTWTTGGTPHAQHVGTIPGLEDWDIGARLSLVYSALCASEVSGIPCYLDSLADTTSRAVQAVAQRVGGAVIPGDPVPQGSRGHLVIDPSDEELNVSNVVS